MIPSNIFKNKTYCNVEFSKNCGKYYTNCIFNNCIFKKSISNSEFINCTFNECSFHSIGIGSTDFKASTFFKCYFIESYFNDCNLFSESNLNKTDVTDCIIHNCDLSKVISSIKDNELYFYNNCISDCTPKSFIFESTDLSILRIGDVMKVNTFIMTLSEWNHLTNIKLYPVINDYYYVLIKPLVQYCFREKELENEFNRC